METQDRKWRLRNLGIEIGKCTSRVEHSLGKGVLYIKCRTARQYPAKGEPTHIGLRESAEERLRRFQQALAMEAPCWSRS